MPDQGIDYLPSWRDLAWPVCPNPECDGTGGGVVIDVSDGNCAWQCQACGWRWVKMVEVVDA